MKILRLSTLSLTLAIAVFALGYVNPSFADPGDGKHNHGGGGGGNVKTGTTFSVEVITMGDANAVNTTACENGEANPGTTDGNLTAGFPAGCLVPDVMAGGTALYLLAIIVRDKKLDVLLFFSDVPIVEVTDESLYVSDRLPGTIVDSAPGDFHIVVTNPAGVVLTKAHQPAKGTPLAPIFVGNIVYTANPP